MARQKTTRPVPLSPISGRVQPRIGGARRLTPIAMSTHIRDAFRAVDPGFEAVRTERGAGYRWVDGSALEGAGLTRFRDPC